MFRYRNPPLLSKLKFKSVYICITLKPDANFDEIHFNRTFFQYWILRLSKTTRVFGKGREQSFLLEDTDIAGFRVFTTRLDQSKCVGYDFRLIIPRLSFLDPKQKSVKGESTNVVFNQP